MTLPATSSAVPSDSELLRIAVAPHQRLFPYLNRTSALAPLILVCCVFPSLQMLTNPVLDDEASMWGLRALAFAKATIFQELLEPGIHETGQPLIYQPPLATWLNGIVIRIFDPTQVWACSLVSLVATGIGIWLLTRIARRIGGANAALSSAILLCTLPQTLRMAISPGHESIGFLLMLASVFGFQRHLEGKSTDLSLSLAISGITWGFSILALGPVAFLIPLAFVAHAANQRVTVLPDEEKKPLSDRIRQGWPVLKSTLILVGIGLALGGWWEIIMLCEHGSDFWSSWWNSLPSECLSLKTSDRHRDPSFSLMPSWQDWLNQNALMIGWLAFGLRRSWKELFQPSSEMMRRRYQLLLLWWTLAFIGRVLVEYLRPAYLVNTAVWNLAWLAPTVLLASLGIGALIERSVSHRSEFFLLTLLVTLTVYRMTSTWILGATAGALIVVLFWCVPRLMMGLGRLNNIWAEAEWRQILQVAVYGSLLACLVTGIGSQNLRFQDEDHLAELRDKLSRIPDVSRISMIATRDPIPISLRYLLRCRWPKVEIATNEGWDSGLTRTMNEESQNPVSRFLILEWTRRNVHLSVDSFQGWQMKSVGDPMRIHGRRLSLILIEPQS